MTGRSCSLHRVCVLAFLLLLIPAVPRPARGEMPGVEAGVVPEAFVPSVEAYFTENRGQVPNSDVLLYARWGSMGVGLTRGGYTLTVESVPSGASAPREIGGRDARPRGTVVDGAAVRVSFVGSNPVTPAGAEGQATTTRFYLGSDPASWRLGVRTYRGAVYTELYDGIDLVLRATAQGMKYEWRLRAGASLEQVRVSYEGIGPLALSPAGDLLIPTPSGPLVDARPVGAQDGTAVLCGFVLRDASSYDLACDPWDRDLPFVVDPLLYSTFLGGSGGDEAYSVTLDDYGNAFVAGVTNSWDFPTTPGAYRRTLAGQLDVFVAKLDAFGSSLIFSTYFGGSAYDALQQLAWHPSGAVYATGWTNSSDFPATQGAFDTTFNGGTDCSAGSQVCGDAFVARFDAITGALAFSTFLGGTGGEAGESIATGPSGDVYVTGNTHSADFPLTVGALDATLGGAFDAYLAVLDGNGTTLLYSTLLGGSDEDNAFSVAVDASGSAYVAGDTGSTDFPTTPGAFDRTIGMSRWDAFVAKIDPAPPALVYSTFIGGERESDAAIDIAVDGEGCAYITGWAGDGFPTTEGVFDGGTPAIWDAFVAKLNPTGTGLVFSTLLGGDTGGEDGFAIAIDGDGNAYVAGFTYSSDFPLTPDAPQSVYGGAYDAFVAKVSRQGRYLVSSTYLGGANAEFGEDLAIGPTGDVTVVGMTLSSGFPTTPGVLDTTYGGGGDGFVARIGTRTPPQAAPTLAWTGEVEYVSDGLDPESGFVNATFRYEVLYRDEDNDRPMAISVTVERPAGTPIMTIPLALASWVGAPGLYVTGAVFVATTSLPSPGNDYWYAFSASDGMNTATGEPTVPTNAPIVLADNPPAAIARASVATAYRGESLTFDGSGSTDDFGIAAYLWDFGDGTNGSGPVVVHAFAVLGPVQVTLVVRDAADQVASDDVTVVIQNRLPTAILTTDSTEALVASPIALRGEESYDPDGLIVDYAFDFGDGSQADGPRADSPHAYDAPGTYIVTLTVTDNDGGASSVQRAVTVRAPPTAPAAERNWKPFLAAGFSAILSLVGAWAARRRPWREGPQGYGALRAFAAFALPFVAAELATGVVSGLTGWLSVPPLVGVGTVVDLGILVSGLAVCLGIAHRPSVPK